MPIKDNHSSLLFIMRSKQVVISEFTATITYAAVNQQSV